MIIFIYLNNRLVSGICGIIIHNNKQYNDFKFVLVFLNNKKTFLAYILSL